jgi:hypothetical protein
MLKQISIERLISMLAVDEKFLVILASVQENEETDAIDSQIPAHVAGDNIIEFDIHLGMV